MFSVNSERCVMGVSRELCLVLQVGAIIQGNTHVGVVALLLLIKQGKDDHLLV